MEMMTSSFSSSSPECLLLRPSHAKATFPPLLPRRLPVFASSHRRERDSFASSSSSLPSSLNLNPRIFLALALASALPPSPQPANAASLEDIVQTISKVQEVSGQVYDAVGTVYGTSKDFLEQLFVTVKPAVDTAAPYIKAATDAAIQVATPVASDVAIQADQALRSAGVDTRPVVEAAKSAAMVAGEVAEQTVKVLEGAKPVASWTFESVANSDPLVLAGGAGALVLLYLFTPSILSGFAYAVRGYKGDLSAPQALDLLTKEDFVLIDVRTEKEKSKSGIPSLPRNARNKVLSIPLEELPAKLKGQLKNSRKLEAELVAVKVSYLKKINRGSGIVILDSFGDISKIVAKSLTNMGFKNVCIVSDGFNGGKGWVQSRLGADSYNLSIAEILSPSRIIPSDTKKIFGGSSSSIVDVPSSRQPRLLPGGNYED